MKLRGSILFVAMLAFGGNATAQPQHPSLKVGMPTLSMFTIMYHVAQDKGFFDREGVNVAISHFEGGATNMRALLSRSVDVSDVETGLILSAVSNGADNLRIFGTHGHRLHFALYAKKDIHNLNDLYGRTFAIASLGGLTHHVLLALLDHQKLDADRISLLNVGGTGARLSALAAGKVDATFGEFSPTIEVQPSLHRLMIVSRELPSYMAGGIAAYADTLSTKRDAIERFHRGLVKTTRWAYENKQEMILTARKYLPASAADLEKIYDFYKEARVWAINGEIEIESVNYMQDLGLKTKTQSKTIDAGKLVDTRIYALTMSVLGNKAYPK